MAAAGTPSGDEATWRNTLETVAPSVVSLRVTATRDFDTENASVSQGTGFIVDAERGLILTNRHMVHAGPVLSEAILLNNEELELEAIYRDPVHDFGIYRFDPSQVRNQDIEALSLDASAARVGMEIRVIGNDAGEKLSILDGTLARLDRNAPNYGANNYNDFNTFYYQAASNTSGGSSGSPVIDEAGNVVALNAGGSTGAASSFYLPLNRVERALALVQAGEPVPRGTLQAMFRYTPYDELVRLGLSPKEEKIARELEGHGTGMLVLRQVVPGGPADGKLRVGDILLSAAETSLTEFVPLEAVLDDNVGKSIAVRVLRGGEEVSVELTVDDLHAITPDRYLEVSRGIVHNLSYQQARNHFRKVQGVYVAVPGYMFGAAQVPSGAILDELDGVAVPNLETFERELASKAQGQRIRVRFNMVNDPLHAYETVAVMDRRWYPMRTCVRNDENGAWPCLDSAAPPAPSPPPPASAMLFDDEGKPANALGPSLVLVDFDIPHPTAGVKDLNYVGVGTIVDADQGLLLVDRDTVPVALGDLMLTFAGTIRVPARLRYMHPVHNFAVLQYDPSALGDTPVSAVQWSERGLDKGDTVWQVGRNADHALVSSKTTIERYDAAWFGISGTPRFRDANVEVIDIAEAEDSLGGVLVDKKGRVQALWSSFLDQATGERGFHGLPADLIRPTLEAIAAGNEPIVRSLGVELHAMPILEARDRGLSDVRIRQLLEADSDRRTVLEVQRVHGATPAQDVLRDTDLLLELEGQLLTRMSQIESTFDKERVNLTILRDGKEMDVAVDTVPLGGQGVDRVVSWAGLILHGPHAEVSQQRGIDAQGVYVAWLWYGSPGSRYRLRPTRRVVRVDDVETPTLDAFLAAVQGKGHREAVALGLEALDGSERVSTLKLDLRFWPTQVFDLKDGVWERTNLDEAVETQP